MEVPKVTVLMPVYNGEKYLGEAIESILNQTFTNFEFLIIDDGSTDNSVEIINSYNDKRIIFVKNDKNLKLPTTLNKGIKLAQGEYIARMDCDDISVPDRLEKQVNYLDNHLDVGICGSRYEVLDEGIVRELPLDYELIKARLLFHCVIKHPTVMMRKFVLNQNNLYYQNTVLEDFDLWIRCSKVTKIINLPEPLLKCRYHEEQVTAVFKEEISDDVDKQLYALIQELGIRPTVDEWNLHKQLKTLIPTEYYKNKRMFPSEIITFKSDIKNWFSKILKYNKGKDIFNQIFLSEVFETYMQELEFAENKIVRQLKKIKFCRSILIWGTGSYGERIFNLLKANEIIVDGFLDNDPKKTGKTLNGKLIYTLELLKKSELDKPFILVASMYHKEISIQLEKDGFLKNVDFICDIKY